jgi:hypothetical protein
MSQVPLEVLESLGSNKRVYNVILENYPSLLMCRSLSDNGKLNTIPESSILPARVPVAAIKATKRTTAHVQAEATHRHPQDDAGTPLLESHGQDEHRAIAVIARSPKSSMKKHDKHESGPTIKKQIFAATQSPHYLQHIRVHR